METIFDLQALREELNSQEWEETYEDDIEERRVYLGSVFSLTPSGKYYLPFACSNVAGDCDMCKGTGWIVDEGECNRCGGLGSMSAYDDEIWYEQAEKELESIGLSLCAGEGDPCDLFAVETRDKPYEDEVKANAI